MKNYAEELSNTADAYNNFEHSDMFESIKTHAENGEYMLGVSAFDIVDNPTIKNHGFDIECRAPLCKIKWDKSIYGCASVMKRIADDTNNFLKSRVYKIVSRYAEMGEYKTPRPISLDDEEVNALKKFGFTVTHVDFINYKVSWIMQQNDNN